MKSKTILEVSKNELDIIFDSVDVYLEYLNTNRDKSKGITNKETYENLIISTKKLRDELCQA